MLFPGKLGTVLFFFLFVCFVLFWFGLGFFCLFVCFSWESRVVFSWVRRVTCVFLGWKVVGYFFVFCFLVVAFLFVFLLLLVFCCCCFVVVVFFLGGGGGGLQEKVVLCIHVFFRRGK